MRLSQSGLSAVVVWVLLLTVKFTAAADEHSSPSDVVAAFDRVETDAVELTFSTAGQDWPPGGHIQGIQFQYDDAGQRWLAFLSHDSRSFGYVVVVSFDDTLNRPGEVIHVHRFEEGRLRHAGGIQLFGNLLVVGLEDNRTKDRSEIRFWDVSTPTDWRPLHHLTVRRTGAPKDKTAGAAGVVAHNDRLLLAVANWDSRDVDLYQSSEADFRDESCRLKPLTRWSVSDAHTSDWGPDELFGSYQAVNLIRQADGQLYLLGFCQAQGRRDVADLFLLDPSAGPGRQLRKQSSRQIKLSDDVTFKYGGGCCLHRGQLWLLATERSLGETVRINLAR